MRLRYHHEMAVIVGIAVHYHKGRGPTPENQVLGVTLCTRLRTEDTSSGLLGQNIGHAPRRPDNVGHAPCLLLTCAVMHTRQHIVAGPRGKCAAVTLRDVRRCHRTVCTSCLALPILSGYHIGIMLSCRHIHPYQKNAARVLRLPGQPHARRLAHSAFAGGEDASSRRLHSSCRTGSRCAGGTSQHGADPCSCPVTWLHW